MRFTLECGAVFFSLLVAIRWVRLHQAICAMNEGSSMARRMEKERIARYLENKRAPVLTVTRPRSLVQRSSNWEKRVVVAHGPMGTIAACHLASLQHNRELAKTAHRWLFDTYDIVLGDFNATHGAMLDVSVAGTTHGHATMPSYLPARSYSVSAWPPSFDQVVVRRPLQVALADAQLWKLQKVKDSPRKQMWSHCIPSDHVPVEAVVRGVAGANELRVATWNVADPWYYTKYHDNGKIAAEGFVRGCEAERCDLVARTVGALVERNQVVALQEVPHKLVRRVVLEAKARGLVVGGMPTPAHSDELRSSAPYLMLIVDPRAGMELSCEALGADQRQHASDL